MRSSALIALIVSLVVGLGYMRFVDTDKRMVCFVAGAVVATASYFLLVVAGFSLTTLVLALFLANVGHAFAFEGIMKVWTQESFPTMLRSTAQGAIVAVARVTAALLAVVTPALLEASARGFYAALGVLAGVGFLIGGVVFRRSGPGRAN